MIRHRTPIRLAAATLAALMAAAAPGQEPVPTISADELTPGQQGWGLSVFAGREPERFAVELLGVVRNPEPDLSYLLVRLSGRDLERSGMVAGMSGSPVYFDDRLAGALSFGYRYGVDPIAGVTPIDAMRQLSAAAPAPPAAGATSLVGWEELVKREFSPDLVAAALDGLVRPPPEAGLPALQWSAAGFGEEATALLRRAVGDLAPWGFSAATGTLGGTAPGPVPELAPGSAVAALLIQGDLRLAAFGTVTDRRGDEILAFGHPVFGLGPVSLPMAAGEVVTVIASRYNSFKISNAGPVVGAFDLDRETGARGRVGAAPAAIDLNVRVRGTAERGYAMRIAPMPQLTPSLVAIGTLGGLSAASHASGPQGLDLTARFRLAGGEELVVRQSFDGNQAGQEVLVYLLTFTSFLVATDLAEVRLEAIDVELEQAPVPRTATLLRAWTDRPRVEPGDRIRVHLELRAFQGERYRRVIETVVPADLPAGPYYLLIGDGTSMDAARLLVAPREPESWPQALELLRAFHSRRELMVLGLVAGSGLALGGEVMPQLPGSLQAIFGPGGTPSAGTPLGLAIAHQQSEPQDRPLNGILRLDLEVRRR